MHRDYDSQAYNVRRVLPAFLWNQPRFSVQMVRRSTVRRTALLVSMLSVTAIFALLGSTTPVHPSLHLSCLPRCCSPARALRTLQDVAAPREAASLRRGSAS